MFSTKRNTITLCSLAEPDLTRCTIENAIGWTAHMKHDQIIKCQNDGKPVLNIEQKQKEFIRRIKESSLHFRIKRIFHVIHPNLAWQHERTFTDNAMRYLKLFVKNDIPFTLVPSEEMTEDLERLLQNSPPLYDKIIRHLETKENSSVGTQKFIDVEKLIAELRRQKRELELSIQSQGDYGQSCHIVAYENILSLIISLQQEQPEVDLEKLVNEEFASHSRTTECQPPPAKAGSMPQG